MTILWINLAIVFVLSFFSRYFAAPAIVPGSTMIVKPNKMLALGVLLTLVLVSGLRTNIGDTYFYKHIYEMSDFSWSYIQSQKDMGFGIFQKILKSYSSDPQILILSTAIITNVPIVLIMYKYTRLFELSMYVYITGGLFLVTMNGMRQCLAAAIVFTATRFLLKGHFWKYALVVLFAATFHESALVLIPIYFIVRQKAWTKATFVLLAIAVLIVFGFNQFSSILFSALQDTQYGEYQHVQEQGANVLRAAVYAVPVIISFFGKEKLRKLFPESDVIVNMTILGLVFMIIATKNWIFARFSIYFDLYQCILISWIIKLFREKDQKLVYYTLLVCYLYYYFYESVISLGIIYNSDYLKL
jgi:transmembrane protein EpsG